MVAATVSTVAEAAKGCCVLIWNVRNHDETGSWLWICMGTVIVFLMVSQGGFTVNPITDDCRQWKVTGGESLHGGFHTVDGAHAQNERRVLKSRYSVPNETLMQLLGSEVMKTARNAWTAAWISLSALNRSSAQRGETTV